MTVQTLNIDNKLVSLARRYSEALVDVAKEKNELDDVLSDLQNVVSIFAQMSDFRDFVSHPVIPVSEKKDLINSVFSGKIKEDTLNLIFILAEKNRIGLLSTILYCYEEALNVAKNILKVSVTSACELDEDLKIRLKEKLESKLQKSVKFEYEINPDIIAGLILKIQDKTIDGSMATKLQAFKKTLGN